MSAPSMATSVVTSTRAPPPPPPPGQSGQSGPYSASSNSSASSIFPPFYYPDSDLPPPPPPLPLLPPLIPLAPPGGLYHHHHQQHHFTAPPPPPPLPYAHQHLPPHPPGMLPPGMAPFGQPPPPPPPLPSNASSSNSSNSSPYKGGNQHQGHALDKMSPEEALQVIQGAIANASKIPTQLFAKLGPIVKTSMGSGGGGSGQGDSEDNLMSSSAGNNSSAGEALFACTRCNSRHAFEDLSTDLMLCKVRNKSLKNTIYKLFFNFFSQACRDMVVMIKCSYCRSEFQQTSSNSNKTSGVCRKCESNVRQYGKVILGFLNLTLFNIPKFYQLPANGL